MKTVNGIGARFARSCILIDRAVLQNLNTVMLIVGAVVLLSGVSQLASAQGGDVPTWSEAGYNDGLVRFAVGNIFALIEGAFGALVMVVAGLGAIVAAAMGAYRGALALVVVAVGAFILRALVSLFFGEEYEALGVSGDV